MTHERYTVQQTVNRHPDTIVAVAAPANPDEWASEDFPTLEAALAWADETWPALEPGETVIQSIRRTGTELLVTRDGPSAPWTPGLETLG